MDNTAVNHWMKKKGKSPQEVADSYSEWAKSGKYDQEVGPDIYNGPKIIADEAAACFTNKRESLRIIDVACGNGRVGEELSRHGFKNMDGLDPSEGMLELCKKTNLYKNLFQEFIDEKKLPIDNGAYDCLIISGGMGEGQIPCVALNEMIRIVKPDGLILIAMRKAYLEKVEEYIGRLEPLIEKLEQENKIEILDRRVVPNYSFGLDGLVLKLKVKSN